MGYHSWIFLKTGVTPLLKRILLVCGHMMNTAHRNFLGQSRMDSFLLILKPTTLKKFGPERPKISVVVTCVPWKCSKQNYPAQSCAQCIVVSITMETETCPSGLRFASSSFSSLGSYAASVPSKAAFILGPKNQKRAIRISQVRLLRKYLDEGSSAASFHANLCSHSCCQEGIWILNNSYLAHNFGHSKAQKTREVFVCEVKEPVLLQTGILFAERCTSSYWILQIYQEIIKK